MAKIGDNSSMTHLIRVVVAGDIPESQISVIAANFAQKNGIQDYTLEFEVDDSLIGGFVIYTLGSRYDYSVKGQLERIGEFVKRTRDVDSDDEGVSFDKAKVHESLKEAINQFPEEAAVSIDSVELEGLDEKQLQERVHKAFESVDNIEEVGIVRSVSDGVATVSGLDHCMVSELVSFTCGAYGIALNLERNSVGVILLSGAEDVVEGMVCKRTRSTVSVPVGYGLAST